ncbi:hypothetical protein [Aurantimonas coralicida]|uniref:hypothetical protein n=1 Tax=Aurantimonas coralicida TaxID=182270 RepID=UPI001E412105|nr:hypothetical protein [Aurantimonas coralicida]
MIDKLSNSHATTSGDEFGHAPVAILRETDLACRLLHAVIINDHFAGVKSAPLRANEAQNSLTECA